MRRCEACNGPGPCLWADSGTNSGRYCCALCHPEPGDPFFRRGQTVREPAEDAEERMRYVRQVCSYCGQPAGSATCQRQHP